MTHNPFDAERDPALGALLREALAAPDDAAFVARVRAAVGSAPGSAWDFLARWARPGLVAAAALLALGLWYRQSAVQGTGTTPVEAFASADQTPSDVLLALSLEDR
jgi:hypothetical protein